MDDGADTRVFPIAPMSPAFIVLTAIVLFLVGFFVASGVLSGSSTDLRVFIGVLIALGAAVTWLWSRPRRFEISPYGLRVIWPVRTHALMRAAIGDVRILERAAFRDEIGWAMRVGVGGLFGTFGLLYTQKRGWVSVYVTRADRWVLVEPRGGRPLLITPVDPEGFVEAWRAGATAKR